jgi:hypothetical protein
VLLKYNSTLDNSSILPYNGTKMIKKELGMKGSIRIIVGLLITMGAVGTLEIDPNASVLLQVAIATIGLAIMYSGVVSMQRDNA